MDTGGDPWHRSPMTDTALDFTTGPDTTAQLRRAFGRFGTGVTVITAASETGPVGFTANSFSSVSLDPALVLWSIAMSSRRHDAFATATQFCIHILSEDQQDIAAHFAKQAQGFEHFDVETDAHGVPALQGCLARFHCTQDAVHPAGDHSLIIGKVVRAFVQNGTGLAYDQSRYGRFQPL